MRKIVIVGPKNVKLHLPRSRGGWWFCLILLAATLSISSALFLRQNNLNMVKLRDDLVKADKSGEIGEVQTKARRLQNYTATHMNTSTGKIALQTLYNQAAQKAMNESKPVDVSTEVYQQATEVCKDQLVNYGYRAWASCVANKVGISETTSLEKADAKMPDPNLYYVEYAPTRWSADPAGISLLLLIIDLLAMLVWLIIIVIRWIIKYCENNYKKFANRG